MVEHLPDLIAPEMYERYPRGDLVRIQISVEDGCVRILGDALRPELIERLLEDLGPDVVEQMLCG